MRKKIRSEKNIFPKYFSKISFSNVMRKKGEMRKKRNTLSKIFIESRPYNGKQSPNIRPEGGASAPHTLRVIEVKQFLIDPTRATPSDLKIVKEILADKGIKPNLRTRFDESSLKGLLFLSESLQGFLSPLLALDENLIQKKSQQIDTILLRQILTNDAVRPVIGRNPTMRSTQEKKGVITRPESRLRAAEIERNPAGQPRTRKHPPPNSNHNKIIKFFDAAVATEETIAVEGLLYEHLLPGRNIIKNTENGHFMGPEVYSNAGTPTLLGTALLKPPTVLALPPRAAGGMTLSGYKYVPLDGENILGFLEKVLQNGRLLLNFYYGSTARLMALIKAVEMRKYAVRFRGPGAPPLKNSGTSLRRWLDRDKYKKKLSNFLVEGGPKWRNPFNEEKLLFLVSRLLSFSTRREPPPTDLWFFSSSLLYELFRLGEYDAYFYILTEGRDSVEIQKLFENSKIRASKRSQLNELERRVTLDYSKARQYLNIIEEKFGAPRAKTLFFEEESTLVRISYQEEPKNMSLLNTDDLLEKLSSREKEIVLTEYENRKQQWTSNAQNRCPHVPLVRKFREATTSVLLADLFNQLSKFVKSPETSKNSWLVCRVCDFRLICPHVRERIQLEMENASYDTVSTRLLRYAVRVSHGPSSAGIASKEISTYFCRICSEKISEFIDGKSAAEMLGRFGNLDARLRTKIWNEAMTVSTFLRFSVPTDVKRFATLVTSAVYPLLLQSEEALAGKRRRRLDSIIGESEEDLDPRTRLYAVIFIFAYVLGVIQERRGTDDEIRFLGVPPGSKARAYMEAMLKQISVTYRGLLAQIEDLSPEFMKMRFGESFRMIQNSKSILVFRTTDPEEELAMQLAVFDPLYRYALRVAKISKSLPMNRASTPSEAQKEFETIMGSSLPGLVKKARENARSPAVASLISKKSGLEIPPGILLEFWIKNPNINLYSSLYEPSSKTPDDRRSRYFFDSYKLCLYYTKSLVTIDAWGDFSRRLNDLRLLEDALFLDSSPILSRVYFDFFIGKKNSEPRSYPPISRLYDELGRAHSWEVFYYRRRGSERLLRIEGVPAVKRARLEKTLTPDFALADQGCTICGILLSKIDSLDESKVQKALKASTEIETFFVFYETRCPLGQLHDFDRSVCRKCGLDFALFKKISKGIHDREALDYYNRFSQIFQSERKNAVISSSPGRAPSHQPGAPVLEVSWEADHTRVVKVAEFAQVPPSVISDIGSTSGREYGDILEGKNRPPPPSQLSDPRLASAKAELLLLLSNYNQLRFAAQKSRVAPWLSQLLDSAGVLRQDYSLLPQIFPQLTDFRPIYSALSSTSPPEEVLVFIVEFICHIILRIRNVGIEKKDDAPSPSMALLASSFARYQIDLIIKNQKLLAKHGALDYKVIKDIVGEEDDYPDQIGDVGEDLMEDLMARNDEDFPADPFSDEGIDYDTSEDNPNNEPQ